MKMKGIAAVVLAVAALAVAAVPLLVQRPFTTQTSAAMSVAFWLRRWGPLMTALLGVATIALAMAAGRRAGWGSRALLAAAVVLSLGAAWFARQNPFEWWFNRLPEARYVPVGDASFVEPSDLVLAVSIAGDAAAYPIRQIAYHHLVNDRIGTTPAVVTY